MSLENENENETSHEGNEHLSTEPSQSGWRSIWDNNKGMFLVILAEWVGSSMDAMVRFLQQGGHGMHPFQVIVARMGMTFILSSFYMWYTSVPDFPFGNPKVRGWLMLRACFGFGGLFCLYYSVHYLPLAEATVFRFLVPVVTAWACSLFLGQRFRRAEFLAGIIALIGVIFIAHPAFIFGHVADDTIDADKAGSVDDVTSTQRLIAIVVSLLGVIGASGAYTTIRVIGNRAHALMSVNYFAVLGTVGSTIALLVIPGIGFSMPRGVREWVLLLLLGVLGFVLQFLLTAGLQMDRSSKATSMLYTQIIFALGFDWAIWGVLPSAWSWFGGAIVVGSTLWAAVQKSGDGKEVEGKRGGVDEETALLGAQAGGIEEVDVVRRGSA
ncbi:putative membrane protein [Lachnellula occidentalis]|uniref:Putative membrane protein n=1 Tax=Lachnellula occidentalis TaxID=215460 RepID=A0A8H8RE84_9HELO|nr:putative membrane protein [Lachnellula occidentalis]